MHVFATGPDVLDPATAMLAEYVTTEELAGEYSFVKRPWIAGTRAVVGLPRVTSGRRPVHGRGAVTGSIRRQ